MPVLEADELDTAVRSVLTAIQAAAVTVGVDLPARQLVTVGAVVYDCPLVAVTLVSAAPGIVGAQVRPLSDLAPIPAAWGITVGCAIARTACEMPVGPRGDRPPTPEMIASDLATMSGDAAVLLEAAASLAGTQRTGFPSVALTFQGAEGGVVAVTTEVTFNPWGL